MKNARYTDEFKAEAIKQITERGHGVLDVQFAYYPGVFNSVFSKLCRDTHHCF